MALTKAQVREILSAAGVDSEHLSEAVGKIIEGHLTSIESLREEITGLKADVTKYKSEADKLPNVQKELDTLKAEVAKNSDKDYDALKKEYDDYKAEQERKESHAVKEKAFREILKDASIDEKYFDKVIKYSDIDGIELDDKGAVKDAKDKIKSIKEEWSECIAVKQTQGTQTATPPTNTGGMIAQPSRASQIAAQYMAEHYGTPANAGNK